MNTTVFVDEHFSKHSEKYQTLEMITLAFLGFMIPLFLGHPQILVGVTVNAFLIRAALSLPEKKALAVVFSPALGAISRGILFGPFTIFLVYLLPFIWAGNYLLVRAFKYKIKHSLNYGLTLLGGSILKAAFLYTAAYILYSAGILPKLFLVAMGSLQFTTAVLGGLLAYGSILTKERFIR